MVFGLSSCQKTETFKVLQFNIWQEGTVVEGGFEALADEIVRSNADFVTLSEVRNYRNTRFCDRIVEALKKRGETYYSFYTEDSGLLSRYPISDSTTVYPLNDDRGSIYRLVSKKTARNLPFTQLTWITGTAPTMTYADTTEIPGRRKNR